MASDNTNQNASGSYQPVSSVVSSQSPSNRQTNVVTQDATGFGMNASNRGNKNGLIHFQSHFEFEKLTFYKVLHEVIKPTLLTMSGEPFEFRLLLKHIVLVDLCLATSDKQNYFQFQIRIGKIEDDGTLLITDYLPPGLDIKFGFSPCVLPSYNSLPPPNEATQPIDCTNLLALDPSVLNMFFIKWTPDQNNYALTMCLVKRLTVDMLIRRLQEKGGKSSEETQEDIIRMLADPDLVTCKSGYSFSLLCPLGKKRMEIPAKSIHCTHLQCFDAKIFLLMNEKKQTWKCPICDISCLYDEIQIQLFFLAIVTSPELDGDCTDIEFITDGSWIVNENNETKIMNITPNTEKELMNLDEEKCIINEVE
ncbi:E3 SUMO-protein ligase PIAS1-like [Metopolophium dirhodum]|uniref:E3 SUMO-protein ligase PIAS1-like n=1 Tax=Metopolophium dirhodum TaxID=44670 RepID=UPI00298F83A9|nr:E3 SUMO-protein ligase PIAS1-like [Metopolophium dirhodum]